MAHKSQKYWNQQLINAQAIRKSAEDLNKTASRMEFEAKKALNELGNSSGAKTKKTPRLGTEKRAKIIQSLTNSKPRHN